MTKLKCEEAKPLTRKDILTIAVCLPLGCAAAAIAITLWLAVGAPRSNDPWLR